MRRASVAEVLEMIKLLGILYRYTRKLAILKVRGANALLLKLFAKKEPLGVDPVFSTHYQKPISLRHTKKHSHGTNSRAMTKTKIPIMEKILASF